MPCSTSNNFDIRFTLIVEPNKPLRVEVVDNTNYAALGITQSTVKGSVVIHDTEMNEIYRNDSFVTPDIIRANTNTATVTTNIDKPLSNYTGTWTLCYKIQHGTTPNLIQTCEIKTYTIRFKPYCIFQDFIQDCFSAKLRSEDNTNYLQVDATRTEESYLHSLDSATSPLLSSTTKIITQQNPNLYNEEYTATITATNLYTFNTNFRLRYTVTTTKKEIVECHLDTCSAVCCVECLRQRMNENELVNPTEYEKYYELFVFVTGLLTLHEAALRCGNIADANSIGKQIEDLTECNNGCKGCNCNESTQVKPLQQPCQGTQVVTPPPPCPPTYSNTAITGTVSKQCPTPQTGVPLTYTIAANFIYSPISQVDAQIKTQLYFDATKQAYANANGICTGVTCGTLGNAPILGVCCAGLVDLAGICTQPPTCGTNGQAPINNQCCAGLVNQSGICQNTCNSGFTAINGVCVANPTCGNLGQQTVNGTCCGNLVNQSGICQQSCNAGFTNVNGVCVTVNTCPTITFLSNVIGMPIGIEGQPYNYQSSPIIFIVQPSSTNNEFTVVSGTMPTGILLYDEFDLDDKFAILGIPTTAGIYTFTVQAENRDTGCIGTIELTIEVIGF